MKHILFACLFLFQTAVLAGQNADRVSGEILMQLEGDASVGNVLNELNRNNNLFFQLIEPLIEEWRIYHIGFEEGAAAFPEKVLEQVRQTPGVRLAQWNHLVQDRNTTPNDPDWLRQDNMELIGMPAAWDITTGGLTPNGDTIVVAVLEKGLQLSHPDLVANLWRNPGEKPNNGTDDDGNGYIDDYRGWDALNDGDGDGTGNTHGTSVNGIIGARGNNDLSVTGVNWNVKLLNVVNTADIESRIIKGYRYVHKMRHLYNQTQGQKGAFIVATNASWGFDKKRAQDFPAWCLLYDSLGAVGVLNVGATSNSVWDVDAVGDMPTSCASEYLITVTSVDNSGAKASSGAFGKTTIDLGAPGVKCYTLANTSPNNPNGVAEFGGTSGATPHVTGAIALLYGLQCPTLTADALTAPAACARRMRDLILESVKPDASLTQITATGGWLSVSNAVNLVQERCGGTPTGPLEILWTSPNQPFHHAILQAQFQTPNFADHKAVIYNMLGQLIYEKTITPDPFSLSMLEYDTTSLPPGVYVLAFGRNQTYVSKKFVKI